MHNELLLILTLLGVFGSVVLFYCLFDIPGLYCWTAIASIAANIEILILIDAFGMQQTLGNIMFASTFLVTDIISEIGGKKEADTAVNIGIMVTAVFLILSQSWLSYIPAGADWAFPHMEMIFSNTPRLMFTSFIVYGIVQRFDVWAYHKWWQFSIKRTGDAKGYLWLRNNGSTLISQLLNSILFTIGAFGGVYPAATLWQIGVSGFIIFIVTSLADTPFVYLARLIKQKDLKKNLTLRKIMYRM